MTKEYFIYRDISLKLLEKRKKLYSVLLLFRVLYNNNNNNERMKKRKDGVRKRGSLATRATAG